jgi:hypothetical protein
VEERAGRNSRRSSVKQSADIGALSKALVAVQAAIEPVVKDSTNPHFKNRYASLDSILDYVRPLLSSHGLALVQGGGDLINGGLMVTTTIVHESGQWISSSFEMPLEKATPQAAGSAITYGKRYGVSALLALSTDEDDDGQGASKPAQKRSGAKAGEKSAPATPEAPITPDSPLTFGSKKGTKVRELPDSFLQWGLEDGRNFGVRTADWQAAFRKELASRDGVTA